MLFLTPNSKCSSPDLKLVVRNNYIEKGTTVRFLELNVHEYLSWNPHMDYFQLKLRISYGVVKKASAFLNSEILDLQYIII